MGKRILMSALVAAVAVSLAACGSGEGAGGGSAGGNTGSGGGDKAAGGKGLGSQVVLSTYGTGTATYADVAAVTSAISSSEDTKVRIITSDTAVGRLTPLRQGQAQFARTGDEYIFSFEAEHDFANPAWGPQDIRVVWTPVAPHGLLVKDASAIKTFEDLRGKNFPRITANPSVNNKLEAFLAYGGLTWDDVNVVELGYSEQPKALKAGKIDVLFQQVYGASLYELDSTVPVRWLSMDNTDQARIDAVEKVAPSTAIGEFTGAPGQEEGESAKGLIYTVPIVTYEKTDPQLVHAFVSAIDKTYPKFKDSTRTTPDWSLEKAHKAPRQVPFHEGLVTFLKEKNAWTEEAQERQDALLERGEKLDEGWKQVSKEASGDKLATAWAEWKSANLEDK
jgi:TRAP transporter TAXI family solute receptor